MRLLCLVALAGCLRETEFHCATSEQCGSDGRCEASGFCSVADASCAGGRRYGEFSGGLTGQCVVANDAGIDGQGCAPGFLSLPGVPGHQYLIITAAADFNTQRMSCASMGGITYLAYPDDMTELQALLDVTNQPAMWVGIDDLVAQGNWLTVRGMPATYLPWDSGQPDNAGPGEHCVAALKSSTKYDDQKCANALRAACECEP